MTSAEKGRFCGSCQKQVVDFTNMSDLQLVAFFRKESSGSVCGRFMPDQLDRSMDIPKKRIPWVKYFFQFTLPLFLTSLKVNAQKGKVMVKQVEAKADTTKCRPNQIKMGMIAYIEPEAILESEQITGIVLNMNGEPIPYASIVVKGTSQGSMADSAGMFSLTFSSLKKRDILLVSSVGYEPKEVAVTKKDKKAGNSFRVQLKVAIQKEVVVTSYTATTGRDMMGAVGIITRRSSMPVIKQPEGPTAINMKVYPNPISSGSAINIKCGKMEEDYYTFQVLTMSGQQVYKKEIWIDNEARVLNMPMPVLTPGMYLIVMTDKELKKRYTEKVMIQ
jgi:hypothetical protein